MQEQHGSPKLSRCRLYFSRRSVPKRCTGPRTTGIARSSSGGRRSAPSGASGSSPASSDHLAARLAWDGQLYGGAPDPDRAVDLYEPVPGHQGAHGAFDSRAKDGSWELGLTMHASWLATAAVRCGGPGGPEVGRRPGEWAVVTQSSVEQRTAWTPPATRTRPSVTTR